jgi:hypothetical protein
MRKYLLIIGLFLSSQILAQTGIGTTTPNASAKLEVFSTDKGFLPPRVALTATNAASPITNPANGLMVFNTVTAGSSPFQVVPGYYYWDAVGLKWVSLSTTVGNVQNQAVYRSTSSTSAGNTVSTWNSRFNNIAAGDLTVTSNTTFALSNGIYKIEWGLPYQTGSTYNIMQLQENVSSTWSTFLNDGSFANIGNGGDANWGGGTYASDVVNCTSSTRTFRLSNVDGSRALFSGAVFTITKLNPAITTSTTADNLGNHIATKNVELTGNYISNDGGNEGIKIDNAGNVGINTANPTTALDVTGNVNVTGKINLTDPTGNVAVKVSGLKSAGSFISLDNLKVTVLVENNYGGLSIAGVSSQFTALLSGTFGLFNNGSGGSASNAGVLISTTPSGRLFGWGFPTAGDASTYIITDITNSRSYRVTLQINYGFVNNFISIERLL